MSIVRLISPLVPTLNPSDTGNRALALMEDNDFSQLPVIEDDNYVALAQEHELMDWGTPEKPLSEAGFLNYKPAISLSGHPYEALRIINQMSLSVLPVVDVDNKYAGAVTRISLLNYLAEKSGLEGTGGIIVLEMEQNNYSLYQIARICENEDITIINLQIFTTPAGLLEVTLKANKTSLDALVSSFERHGYNVKEVHGDQKNIEDIMGKYNLLMNYLNM